jgi:beta-glucosidase-like glycosyl hydrolase
MSEDKYNVTERAIAFYEGIEKQGVIATVAFQVKAASQTDSHKGLG